MAIETAAKPAPWLHSLYYTSPTLICIILVTFVLVTTAVRAGERRARMASAKMEIATRTLDANRLRIQVTDRGNLLADFSNDRGGLRWWVAKPFPEVIVFDQGPWIIGKLNGEPALGASYWRTSYVPGPIINAQPAPQDSARYHPYKISRSHLPDDPDVMQWPGDLGAPVDPSGKPVVLGDQFIWSIFNGADSTVYPSASIARPFPHLPVEIHQSIYSRSSSTSDTSLLANTAFMEWTFINKGMSVIESCYVALWADLDVYDAGDNPFSIDTVLQTGYCWCPLTWDSSLAPRAAGYTWLFGPTVPDPTSQATVRERTVAGRRNLPLSSFWGMRNDVGPPPWYPVGPRSIEEAWNLARGFDKSGGPIIDSVTMLPTRFPWSGDPLIGTGWIYSTWTEGEAGFFLFSGPFSLAPGDSNWAMAAIVPGAGTEYRQAIRMVRANAGRLRAMTYGDIATPSPLAVGHRNPGPASTFPLSPLLEQNFPNPFNPSTTIRFGLNHRTQVTLTVFNVLGQKVATLVDGDQEAGYHEVIFDGSGLSSGLYWCKFQAGDFVTSKRMAFVK